MGRQTQTDRQIGTYTDTQTDRGQKCPSGDAKGKDIQFLGDLLMNKKPPLQPCEREAEKIYHAEWR